MSARCSSSRLASIGVYGIILGAWASSNRYSLLGGLRSAAQVISYEIILGLVAGRHLHPDWLAEPAATSCTRNSETLEIGPFEISNWYILTQPVAFIIFMIAAVAETNRAPFDLPEAETELVSGFHTEYSAFRFSFYFLGEYIAMIVISLFASTLFLGGTEWTRFAGVLGSRHYLAAAQDDAVPLLLHLAARNAAAIPLRPADGHCLEGAAAAGVAQHRLHRAGAAGQRSVSTGSSGSAVISLVIGTDASRS